jgi:hypothetical protein
MQAILIRTLSPTHRNNNIRYKASCVASSNTVDQVGEFNLEQNIKNSVDKLLIKLGWNDYDYVIGQLKNGDFVAVYCGDK